MIMFLCTEHDDFTLNVEFARQFIMGKLIQQYQVSYARLHGNPVTK